jgi:hypothetical protein
MHVVTLILTPDWGPVLIDDYFPEDFEDTSHIRKAIALSIVKPLLYCRGRLIHPFLACFIPLFNSWSLLFLAHAHNFSLKTAALYMPWVCVLHAASTLQHRTNVSKT